MGDSGGPDTTVQTPTPQPLQKQQRHCVHKRIYFIWQAEKVVSSSISKALHGQMPEDPPPPFRRGAWGERVFLSD